MDGINSAADAALEVPEQRMRWTFGIVAAADIALNFGSFVVVSRFWRAENYLAEFSAFLSAEILDFKFGVSMADIVVLSIIRSALLFATHCIFALRAPFVLLFVLSVCSAYLSLKPLVFVFPLDYSWLVKSWFLACYLCSWVELFLWFSSTKALVKLPANTLVRKRLSYPYSADISIDSANTSYQRNESHVRHSGTSDVVPVVLSADREVDFANEQHSIDIYISPSLSSEKKRLHSPHAESPNTLDASGSSTLPLHMIPPWMLEEQVATSVAAMVSVESNIVHAIRSNELAVATIYCERLRQSFAHLYSWLEDGEELEQLQAFQDRLEKSREMRQLAFDTARLKEAKFELGPESEGWSLVSGKSWPYSVEYRHADGSNLHYMRIKGNVTAPLYYCVAGIDDVQSYQKLVPLCSEARQLTRPNQWKGTSYLRVATPWPITHRDCVVQGLLVDELHLPGEDCCVTVVVNSMTEEEMEGLDIPATSDSSIVRVESKVAAFQLRATSSNTISVNCVLALDPKLAFVPNWLLKWANKKLAATIFSVASRCEKMSETDYLRIKNKNPAVYTRLEEQLGKMSFN